MQDSLVEEKIAMIDNIAASHIVQKEFSKSEILIESRFGSIRVQPTKAICFAHGLPGMPGSINFCITDLPGSQNNQFKLLQSLNDPAVSFVVIPSAYDNQLLEVADTDEACTMLNISKNNLLLLFIVTVHETPSDRKISINAKAPIFIDVSTKAAAQYVFQNNNYEIQHFVG